MKNILTVERPANTRTTKKNGITYVQITAEKRYRKDKGYNVDKRISIGRMINDTDMIPNDNFIKYFPELMPLAPAPSRSDTLKIGNYILFRKIMSDNDMGELIDTVYEEKAAIMKDIFFYMVIQETNVFQHYPDYGFDHPTHAQRIYSDNRISQLLNSIPLSRHDLFLEKWNSKHTDVEDIYISYDSTNMNSAATGAQLLEYGKSKDAESKLPQLNVSIGFDQNHLTPLFYEVYPGSIIDNTQCELMVEKIKRYGYKNIGFVIDRGYFSIENIKYFISNAYDYIIMAKMNALFVQEAFHEAQYKLRLDPKYYLIHHELSGMTVKYPFNKEYLNNQYMHVYYDDVRASLERRAMAKKFQKYDEKLAELTDRKVTRRFEVKNYGSYYDLQFHDEYLIGYSRKEEEIKKAIDRCGYFVIITSKEMTAGEALERYRYRDTSEKLFLADKTFLDADVVRGHTDENIESRQMLSFLALIIRNAIFKQTKVLKQNDRKTYTVPSILREMEKIIITKDGKGQYHLRYALTNTQKTILNQFDIKEKDLKQLAAEICIKYSD